MANNVILKILILYNISPINMFYSFLKMFWVEFRNIELDFFNKQKTNMGILSWIVFGLIAGAFAKLIMPGNDPGGFDDIRGILITVLIGISGAVIGGLVGSLLGIGSVNSFSIKSFSLAIIGALILLYGYNKIKED